VAVRSDARARRLQAAGAASVIFQSYAMPFEMMSVVIPMLSAKPSFAFQILEEQAVSVPGQ